MVTVGYERIKGLREPGQRRGGGFDVNKSKTLPVPVAELYQAFADPDSRREWLGDVDLEVKKTNADKSVRWTWPDETPVDVYFWTKGEAKSQLQLQHRRLPSKEAADEARAAWTERIARLTDWLSPL